MKKRNTLLLLLLAIFFLAMPNYGNAQKMQDVVYLKNGSILHGELTNIEVNESVTLLSNCGDTWVFQQAEIEKIEKQPFDFRPLRNDTSQNISYRGKGFYSNINVGFLFGGDMDTPFPPLSLMFVSGYKFDWGMAVGAGLGLDLIQEAYMPAVVDLRYTFRNTRVSHFVYVQGGYAISLENPDPYDYDYYSYDSGLKSKGGYLVNPGIGFKLNLNEKNAFSFGIGYKYSEIYHTYTEYNGQKIDRTIKYNRITLTFGYFF